MTIGERLKEERLRIGITQSVLAEHCGVSKNTQLNYEKNERSPDGAYLEIAALVGVDVLYVITGRRLPADLDVLSSAELDLLRFFKGMSPDDQVSFLRVAKGMFIASNSVLPD
ncbi:helix-turn-helix domain-containing protein [Pseudomonas nitroreducens]|uniref:Helix-turn-helix transcriptional regulator n=1 Tax=Pseudomonas nitroreducens TaxID=46680 RepID=A0A6G6IV90_PSENT|nr:helix-turn-helix transcriptional regulator [Pseudomonas nitroreducens]QIE87018.1 helix-turn-helix transcriptional regulator [Pseudomonas nitroreducens]